MLQAEHPGVKGVGMTRVARAAGAEDADGRLRRAWSDYRRAVRGPLEKVGLRSRSDQII